MSKEKIEQKIENKTGQKIEIKDASIPSEIKLVVVDDYANVRKFPTHIAVMDRRVPNGTKLSFEDLVTGEFLINSDKWYKLANEEFVHESQVKEILEVKEVKEVKEGK